MKDEHITTKDKKFIDGQRSLYTLLIDHPHFQDKVKKIRKQIEIPTKGFGNSQKAFDWESQDKTKKELLTK
jgi:5-formaminoimidazole-4-carboxamide-1-beta-D-ribofuranosyl 5'-monophosphate synthetase